VETEGGPEGGPTVRPFRMQDECAKRLVSEGFPDGAVRGDKRERCEVNVECTLGDAVHEKYNEMVSIF
jgi:hypothetical protein